jgi:hypothetical protein
VEAIMGLLNMWREARGNVMRRELDDVMRRLGGANQSAIHGFYNNIWQTIDELKEGYRPATTSERKAILKECRRSAKEMWNRGDWPSSLGLAINCLNIEN